MKLMKKKIEGSFMGYYYVSEDGKKLYTFREAKQYYKNNEAYLKPTVDTGVYEIINPYKHHGVTLLDDTLVPNNIIRDVVEMAGISVGAELDGVLVHVRKGRSNCIKGEAVKYYGYHRFVNEYHGYYHMKKHFFFIVLPSVEYARLKHDGYNDSLSMAIRFVKTLLHEWGHVYDFQNDNGKLKWKYDVRWKERPQEKRAIAYQENTLQLIMEGKIQGQDEILRLAEWFEENTKNNF